MERVNKELKVGDTVLIKSRPKEFSGTFDSGFQGKQGLNKVNYPYKLEVIEVTQRNTPHTAFRGKSPYGWTWFDSIMEIIEEESPIIKASEDDSVKLLLQSLQNKNK